MQQPAASGALEQPDRLFAQRAQNHEAEQEKARSHADRSQKGWLRPQ